MNVVCKICPWQKCMPAAVSCPDIMTSRVMLIFLLQWTSAKLLQLSPFVYIELDLCTMSTSCARCCSNVTVLYTAAAYRATTSFSYCWSTASLPVWPHCVNARRIRCQADLNSLPLGELEETTGTPPYYMDEDYPAGPGIIEPLPEWSNWRGSESSTLENDVYVWCYALIVVTDRN